MPVCTLQNIFDDTRGYLNDTAISGGETFTNSVLQQFFSEPYRTMFSKLFGVSKRVQRVVYVTLPANQNVLIPSTFGVLDMSEPEMIEERSSSNQISVTATSTTTPIVVTAPSHGLGSTGQIITGSISGIVETAAPWGNWFATIINANSFSLNGSASDGIVGTTGSFYPQSTLPFSEVDPIDISAAGLDGPPQAVLGVYLWIDEMLQFRGATGPIQLRITYYASGTPPTNPNYSINIDNARDFLGVATAANAALSRGWIQVAEALRNRAYGDPSHPEQTSLIDLFYLGQVLANQRGPQRRQGPFRNKRYRYGTYLLG